MLSELIFFFFNDTATTEIYTLSLHDALPIYILGVAVGVAVDVGPVVVHGGVHGQLVGEGDLRPAPAPGQDHRAGEPAVVAPDGRRLAGDDVRRALLHGHVVEVGGGRRARGQERLGDREVHPEGRGQPLEAATLPGPGRALQ